MPVYLRMTTKKKSSYLPEDRMTIDRDAKQCEILTPSFIYLFIRAREKMLASLLWKGCNVPSWNLAPKDLWSQKMVTRGHPFIRNCSFLLRLSSRAAFFKNTFSLIDIYHISIYHKICHLTIFKCIYQWH